MEGVSARYLSHSATGVAGWFCPSHNVLPGIDVILLACLGAVPSG